DLETALSGSLGAPAPAGNVVVTIESLDPGKLLVATSATASGATSIAFTVNAGGAGIPAFYVHALTDTGTAQLRTTAPGYVTDLRDRKSVVWERVEVTGDVVTT